MLVLQYVDLGMGVVQGGDGCGGGSSSSVVAVAVDMRPVVEACLSCFRRHGTAHVFILLILAFPLPTGKSAHKDGLRTSQEALLLY